MISSCRALLVLVVAAFGCSSSGGDDDARAGEECSRGTTTAACDACAQRVCQVKYSSCFHDGRVDVGDRLPPGLCVDRARCIAHCACGDADCYDACTTTQACTDCIAQLRDCEAVSCSTDCRDAVAGLSDACIDLARCCVSPRLPEGSSSFCLGIAATGVGNVCANELKAYRESSLCD